VDSGRFHRLGERLQIVGVAKEDAGVYTCVADNGYATDSRELQLVVTGWLCLQCRNDFKNFCYHVYLFMFRAIGPSPCCNRVQQ